MRTGIDTKGQVCGGPTTHHHNTHPPAPRIERHAAELLADAFPLLLLESLLAAEVALLQLDEHAHPGLVGSVVGRYVGAPMAISLLPAVGAGLHLIDCRQ